MANGEFPGGSVCPTDVKQAQPSPGSAAPLTPCIMGVPREDDDDVGAWQRSTLLNWFPSVVGSLCDLILVV